MCEISISLNPSIMCSTFVCIKSLNDFPLDVAALAYDATALAAVLFAQNNIKEFSEYKNIKIKGLMTILPQGLTQKQKRNLYNKTYRIQQKIQKEYFKSCSNLSMGMTNDYVDAIKEGATHIRIGTALFGSRNK